jgi:hypothetical protein
MEPSEPQQRLAKVVFRHGQALATHHTVNGTDGDDGHCIDDAQEEHRQIERSQNVVHVLHRGPEWRRADGQTNTWMDGQRWTALSVCLSVCLPTTSGWMGKDGQACLSVCLSVCLSACLPTTRGWMGKDGQPCPLLRADVSGACLGLACSSCAGAYGRALERALCIGRKRTCMAAHPSPALRIQNISLDNTPPPGTCDWRCSPPFVCLSVCLSVCLASPVRAHLPQDGTE